MDFTQVKSPDRIRMEKFVNFSGYVLLNIILFVVAIILFVVVIIGYAVAYTAKVFGIQVIHTILSSLLSRTRFAGKARSTSKFLSENVSPLAALVGFCCLGSVPIVIGATLQEHGPELEEFWLQTKASLGSYLPIPFFLLGSIVTYLLLRLLPGYNATCVRINQRLHAPTSVLELLEHKPFPGVFPPTLSENVLDEIKKLLLAKDKEITSLRNNLQNEDDELAEVMAEKDEEISKHQTILQQKDEEIAELRGIELHSNPQGFSEVKTLSLARRILNTQYNVIERQGREKADASRCNQKLTRDVAALGCQIVALKKELSKERNEELPPPRPRPVFAEAYHKGVVNDLQAQISRRDKELANAQQYIAHLEAEAAQGKADFTKAQQSVIGLKDEVSRHDSKLASVEQCVTEVEARLSQRDSDLVMAQQSITDLNTQLTQHNSDLAIAQQSLTDLNTQLTQRNSDLAIAQQSLSILQSQPVQDPEATIKLQACQEKVAELEKGLVGAHRLHTQYEELRHQWGLQVHRHTTQINLAGQEITALRQRLDLALRHVQVLEAAPPASQVGVLRQHLDAAQRKIHELEGAPSGSNVGTLQQDLDLAQRKIQVLEAALPEADLRRARAEAKFHDREKEFFELKEKAKILQWEVDDNKKGRRTSFAPSSSVQKALKDQEESAKTLETELKEAKQLVTQLEAEKEEMAGEVRRADALKMVAEARLDQRASVSGGTRSPRKRGQGEDFENPDRAGSGSGGGSGGGEKRHQKRAVYRTAGDGLDGVFSSDEE